MPTYISSPQYNKFHDFAESETKDKKKEDVGILRRSERSDKTYKVLTPEGKTVHFGDPDMPIKVNKGTGKSEAAESYCARSNGIKDSGKWSANALSRRMWKCSGSGVDYSKSTPKIGDKIYG